MYPDSTPVPLVAHRRRWLPLMGHQWPTHHTGGVLSGYVHCISSSAKTRRANFHFDNSITKMTSREVTFVLKYQFVEFIYTAV